MSKDDDGGFAAGGRGERGNDQVRGAAAGGSPGKATLTQGSGRISAPAQVYARVDHARALVELVRGEMLPRLRATHGSDEAQAAASALRRDLDEIDRDLREARRMTRDPEVRAEIDEVARDREALRFEVAPALAKVPAPAAPVDPAAPVLIHHDVVAQSKAEDARDSAAPIPNLTVSYRHDVNPRISVEYQLKLDASDPLYEADTAVGRLKGLQPELKLQRTAKAADMRLSAALAKITNFETEVIDGVTFSVETEIINVDATLGSQDDRSAKGPQSPEITMFGLTFKMTGDLTQLLKDAGLDPSPYKVKVEGRIKIRLDPADALHAARALAQFLEARRLQRLTATLEAEALALRAAKKAAESEISALRRSGRSPAKLAAARRNLRRLEQQAGTIRKRMEALRKLVTRTESAFDEAADKLTSKAGKAWANAVQSRFARLIGAILASLGTLLVVLDIVELLDFAVGLALGRAKFHLGGGGTQSDAGGEEIGGKGSEPDGDADGTQGHAPTDEDSGNLQVETPQPTEEGWVAQDAHTEGDGTGTEGVPQRHEVGHVTGPGEVDLELATRTPSAEHTDEVGAARGDSEARGRIVLAEDSRAQRIAAALEARGLQVSDELRGYIEIFVPEDLTDAEVDALIEKLAAWVADPANQIEQDLDEERIVQLLAAEIAAGIERRAAADGEVSTDPTKVGDGPGEGGGQAGGGASKRRAGGGGKRHQRRKAKRQGRGHGGRFGGRTKKPTRTPEEPKSANGRLDVSTEVVEQWLEVADGQVRRGKRVDRWLKAHGKEVVTVVEGVRYHATDVEVTGTEAREGEYAVNVVVIMSGPHGKERRFPLAFTYRPGAEKGQKFITNKKISIRPIEEAAYLDDDGRPAIDATKDINMVDFKVRVKQLVSLETPGGDAATHRVYLVVVVRDVADHNDVAMWRGVEIKQGAVIEGEFDLHLRGEKPA